MSSKTNKIAMVIAHRVFQDIEYGTPKKIFEEAGYEITTASSDMSEAIGKYDGRIMPDMLLKDIKPENFDALVFVGGGGAEEYFLSEDAHHVAKDFYSKDKVVSAICIAPNILANAGLLTGINATCWNSENLIEKGAKYTGNQVERVDKIITGKNPEAAEEFARTILEALN